jgi:multidrug efflux pump subunit AcrA (membrane-fusion protein)
MPENTPPIGDPQAGNPVTPQAGDPPQPTPQAGDGKDYERIISELRKENASHRTKLKSFEDAQAQAEAAKLSETERLAKRAEAAETQAKQYQQQLQATQVKLAAQSLGFANPELAARLITLGDDVTPEAITKALGDLLKSDPYLASSTAQAPSSGGNPTNPQRGNNAALPTFRTSEVAQWSVDDFAKNQAAYAAAIRDGRVIEDR